MKKDAGYSIARWTLLVAVAAVLGAGTSPVTSAQIKLGPPPPPPLPLPYYGYTLTDLGAGNSSGWSFAYAINNLGEAVGDMTEPTGVDRAFRTQGNQPINFQGSDDLGVLSGDYRSYAWAINNAGVAVGESLHILNFTQTRAIRSTGPTAVLEDLHTNSTGNFPTNPMLNMFGVTNTHAQGINDDGWIVGYYTDTNNHTHSLVSFGPTLTQPIDLSWYGNPFQSATFDVNNNDQMVGWRSQLSTNLPRAFMFDAAAGVMRTIDIGMLPGGLTSTAYSINDSAVVVGESQTSTTTHAFLFQDANNNGFVDPGELKDLDTVNSSQSGARSVNNHGAAVGYFGDCAGVIYCLSHAAIFSGGTVTDLNTQVRGGTGVWTLRVATGINDNGQIVGFMEDSNPDNQARVRHAFRLDLYTPIRLPIR
jgi:probable HAF family extracellular repeat protein